MNIYSIYDNRAKTWGTPFFQPTPVHALRLFKSEVNRQDNTNMLYMYPGEYDLYQVGTWDDDTGELAGQENTQLANGNTVKEQEK